MERKEEEKKRGEKRKSVRKKKKTFRSNKSIVSIVDPGGRRASAPHSKKNRKKGKEIEKGVMFCVNVPLWWN